MRPAVPGWRAACRSSRFLPNTDHQPLLRADPPHGPLSHRLTPASRASSARNRYPNSGSSRWASNNAFARYASAQLGVGDRAREPAVVGLASELEDPARHRDGDPVGGQLADERVHHFPGRFACDRYAAARRSTSFSCSRSWIRLFASRSSRTRSPARDRRRRADPRSSIAQPPLQARRRDPEVLRDLGHRGIRAPVASTRITSSRNSLGNGLGMVHILPAPPHIDTDQMSPIRAAVPALDSHGGGEVPIRPVSLRRV